MEDHSKIERREKEQHAYKNYSVRYQESVIERSKIKLRPKEGQEFINLRWEANCGSDVLTMSHLRDTYIATGHSAFDINIWDICDDEKIVHVRRIKTGRESYNNIQPLGDDRIVCCCFFNDTNPITIYNWCTGELICHTNVDDNVWPGGITALDANHFLVAGNRKIAIYNAATSPLQFYWTLGRGQFFYKAVEALSSNALVALTNHRLTFWNVNEKQLLKVIKLEEGVDNFYCMAQMNGVLVCGTFRGCLVFYDLKDLSIIHSSKVHDDAINQIIVITGDALVTASNDGSVKIWSTLHLANGPYCLRVLKKGVGAVYNLILVQDKYLLSCGSTHFFNVTCFEITKDVFVNKKCLKSALFSSIHELSDVLIKAVR
ncbi:hypothetical protein AKO1_014317 [Acrasis kona]|uniref:Uncharacterized protein n=1 Tax=Acrasis kona TaxID=1008807 RepID=A0AAW2Z0Y1_9EUKA